MTHTRLVAVLVLTLPTLAIASPRWSEPLDPVVKQQALGEVEVLTTKKGMSVEIAKLMLESMVFATMKDSSRCPGVDIDIVNATARTQWNVELKIEQKLSGKEHTDTIHLPYMPADTQTHVNVPCIQDYTTRSRYAIGNDDPISIGYDARSSKTLPEALAAMANEPVDFLARGRSVTAPLTIDRDGRTMLDELLDTNDADTMHEIVMGIAHSGVGAKELGAALDRHPTGALAVEVAASMSKLPPAQQAGLARTLLGSEIAEQWTKQLEPLIDGRLCNGPRADVMALWLRTQNDADIPVEKLRAHVREKCKLVKTDGAALVVALDVEPARVGVLDTVDADVFAGAVAGWKAAKKPSPSLIAYLHDTHDPKRFDAASAVLPATAVEAAIEAVVTASADDATPNKALWLESALAKLADEQLDDTIADIITKLVDGRVKAPALRDAVKAARSHAKAAADTALQNYANEHSKVFDAGKLAAANIDLFDYLAFATKSLDGCETSLTKLEECAQAIPTYPGGALVKVAATAVAPSFVAEIDKLTMSLEAHKLAEVAKVLRAAGLPLKQDRACSLIDTALRYDRDPEQTIEDVAQIDATLPCIELGRSEVKSRGRKAVLMTFAALIGLFGPLPLGFMYLRRRWRKVKASLPPSTRAALTTGANLEDRLGSNGLGRAMGTAIADARRELANTPARRGLDELDDAMLERITAITRRAVKSGDASTQLVRRGTDAVYIVALPIRQIRPQLVQRYLGAPWPEHVASVRTAAGLPILALIVLCGPDAAEATLLVGYADGTRSSDPDALLDAREARERGANPFRHVMALAVETTATAKAA